MNEERQENTIQITEVLDLFVRSLRRVWWVCLLLIALCSALFGGYARVSYRPQYTASMTFLVNTGSGSAATAAQMAKTFPYILTSGLLDGSVRADTGLTALPAISASSEESTNLCTLSVTGSDAQQCYDVLQSVIVHYPDVAELVVGSTELVMMDQTGVPSQPSNPFSWRQPLMRGALVGVLLSLVLLYLSGRAWATVITRDDLQKVTSARYLGALPAVRVKKRSRTTPATLSEELAHSSAYCEAMRIVSMRIDKAMQSHAYRTLLVSSAAPGEGKTTFVCQLADALSRQGRHVLVIDCDLRNPSVHKALGRPAQAGLAEYLAGAAGPEQIVTALGKGKPDVIFAGRRAGTQTEQLGGDAFRSLLDDLRARYDVILLDTPPCAVMTDALETGESADCALLVVRQGTAGRASVINALASLDDFGVPVLGYTLNVCTGRGRGQSGYGYGGYGYGGSEPLIRQKIHDAGMQDRVIILGKKDNPYPYMRACDLYVQPSRYEGKAVTVREVQLLGKPVVITNYATSASQLADGVDGLIVPMDNAGCAAGIAALLRDPVRMQQLSENCAKRDYTNSTEVEKIYALMED